MPVKDYLKEAYADRIPEFKVFTYRTCLLYDYLLTCLLALTHVLTYLLTSYLLVLTYLFLTQIHRPCSPRVHAREA